MHLTDEQVQRLVDGESPGPSRPALLDHGAACPECGERLAAAAAQRAQILTRLRVLDHPVPPLSAETIINLAQRRRPSFARWAAVTLLTFGLAGAAYAAPGSPLPEWIKALSSWLHPGPESPPRPVVPPPAPPPARAGIAVLPGRRLSILFEVEGTGDSARVSLVDGAEVAVRAESGAAGFNAGADRLIVVMRGGSSNFEVQIPRSAPLVEILTGGKRIFLKTGDRISTGAAPAPDGSYHIPLHR